MTEIDRHDLETLNNQLHLTLHEVKEISFSSTGRNTHSFNRIFLVLSGGHKDSHVINYTLGQKLHMTAGNIYFMPCNTDFGYRFQSDMRFISLHFNLELFGAYDIFTNQEKFLLLSDSSFGRDLSAIIKSEAGLSLVCRLQGLVMRLVSLFVNDDSCFKLGLRDIADKYGPVFEYIRSTADARTRIPEIASHFGYSREHLSREFARDCGVTLKNFIAHELMRRAERLLLEPDSTARIVAEKLNFSTEYYFSRFFKNNSGMTPGEYKRKALEETHN